MRKALCVLVVVLTLGGIHFLARGKVSLAGCAQAAAAQKESTTTPEPVAMKIQAPELTGIDEWINSKPLRLKDLHGKVVALHFWTFGCINCIHNYPWYAGWHKDYSEKGLTVIGVHTPETKVERDPALVRKKVKANGMHYPVAVDRNAETWNAWDNQFWPAVYLIDKHGHVRYRWDGELGVKGEPVIRKKIEELLAEKE
jgi:thiol-disulfide isomerase/thioredoxin